MNSLIRPVRKLYQFFVDNPIDAGEIIANRYKVNRVIGMGSYGIAYECNKLDTNKRVAIKQLRPSKRKNKKDLNLFYNEAFVLSKLNHKAIPNLHERFSFNGDFFYSMDFMEGENLEDLLFEKRQQFDENESLQLLRKLVGLVGYLHSQGIVHGDLRIPNVILQNNHPFLIDFGLAINSGISFAHAREGGKEEDKRYLWQNDYFDLGDLLLFLLYSSYPAKSRKALPWTEELSLHPLTTHLLRRLLGIGEKYSNTQQILRDMDSIFADEKFKNIGFEGK
ncbi:serine/threonine protein kinase [Virgibacillus ndiopensis]|uniref:serine/threonine protein kinase n=1 Tax=Virgibacillus ndiopensis TaxID=2004408 RepID=UPI000C07BF49|nr:protein kinase [Virgibacillus ndiopensis]